MTKLFKILAVMIVAIATSMPAMASPKFSFFGGVDQVSIRKTNITGAYTGKLGMAGGLGVEFMLGSKVGLELDAIYVQRKWDLTASGITVTTAASYVEVPLLLRFWLGQVFSLGAGGYYAQGIGKLKLTSSLSSLTLPDASFTSYGLKSKDYGAVGVAGFNFKLGSSAAFLLEGRYVYGLSEGLQPGPAASASWKFSDIQGFAGLRFGGMK